MSESLGAKQRRFAYQIAKLIIWIEDEMGWGVSIGDAFRDPRLHGHLGEKMAYGRKNSCHKLKLAMDLNLFKPDDNGIMRYCSSTEEHTLIGDKWESMGSDHRWGGHYNDGNHYSFVFNGNQ